MAEERLTVGRSVRNLFSHALQWADEMEGEPLSDEDLLEAFRTEIEAARCQARREALEEACRAECKHCADGLPIEKIHNEWRHRYAIGGTYPCLAYRIRALLQPEETKRDDD